VKTMVRTKDEEDTMTNEDEDPMTNWITSKCYRGCEASQLRIEQLMLEVDSLRKENINLNQILKETLSCLSTEYSFLMRKYRELIECL